MSRAGGLIVDVVLLALLVVGVALGARYYVHERYDAGYSAGHAAAITERARADDAAVQRRQQDNAALAAHQSEDNLALTKEKDDEIADLRRRLAVAPRLRVGPSICPDRPAGPAEAQGAAGGDGADPSPGLVSSRADADFKQLIEAVEGDQATARACQAFLEKNGMVP